MADAVAADQAAQCGLSIGEAVLYGLIQGLTEFLPISSDGHLALAHRLHLGSLPEDLRLSFDVLLHVPTLIAIAVAFRAEILHAYHPRRWRLWPALVAAMLPAGVLGLTCEHWIEVAGTSLAVIGACFLATAVLLVTGERMAARHAASSVGQLQQLEQIGIGRGLLIGLVQALALLPGVSRSGSTIAGGLFARLTPQLAVSFSFLVGLPLIAAAAGVKALKGDFAPVFSQVGWVPLAAGCLASLLSGLAAILLLKLLVRRGRLSWFAAYCTALAALCFVLEWR